MSTTKVLFCILLMSVLAAMPISAQVSSGELVGTITDSSGAGVPNAKIIATNAHAVSQQKEWIEQGKKTGSLLKARIKELETADGE